MAVKFLEPGGDADFTALGTFWPSGALGSPASDFVHGTHARSLPYRPATSDNVQTANGIVADSGSRISFYIYLVALPSATSSITQLLTSGGANVVRIRLTSAGVLQLWDGATQIGSNGSALSTGAWYRISLSYTIASTTVNRFELFKDSVSDISITNATISGTGTSAWKLGNGSSNANLNFRSSDHYVDDSSSLTDTGNIWVTAKRPFSNGTSNGFTTQIGSGGSGYGSGHSPQVNERPLNTANGWSVINVGNIVTEEYNIENQATGDIDISTATIVDYTGWVDASSVTAETASIVINGVSSNISLTNSSTVFTKIAGSATYPAGAGTDIGITTSNTITTVGLYECGVIVAFIPASSVISLTVPTAGINLSAPTTSQTVALTLTVGNISIEAPNLSGSGFISLLIPSAVVNLSSPSLSESLSSSLLITTGNVNISAPLFTDIINRSITVPTASIVVQAPSHIYESILSQKYYGKDY